MGKYTVLLVDDEEEMIRSMMKKIEWESLGFQVVGYAENGVKALELVEEFNPDVVMTDIKMPYMDGLELSRNLNKSHPSTRILIFTGFDEFEYAKEAVRLEIDEYILKPVNSSELTEIMVRLKETLDKERGEIRSIEALRHHYEESLPFIHANFFSALLQGRISESDIPQYIKDYEIVFERPFLCALVIHTSTTHVPEGVNSRQLAASVVKLAMEKLGEKWQARQFSYLDDYVLIAQLQKETKVSELTDDFERFSAVAKRLLGATVTVGIGEVCDNISSLAHSYEGALTAVSYRAIYGSSCAINISEVAPSDSVVDYGLEAELSELLSRLRLGDKVSIRDAITKYVKGISSKGTSLNRHHIYIMELISSLSRFVNNYNITIPGFSDDFPKLYTKLSAMDPEALGIWMEKICFEINDILIKGLSSSTKSFVEKAKEYIRDNYSNPELSLELICGEIGLSQSYFSTVFKRETGSSFISYLTDYRMQKAVKFLIEDNEKSYIIAEKVGYQDANYFSYVFKRKFGMSPSKYRMENLVDK